MHLYVVAVSTSGIQPVHVATVASDDTVSLSLRSGAPYTVEQTIHWIAQQVHRSYTEGHKPEWLTRRIGAHDVLVHVDQHIFTVGDLTSVLFCLYRWRQTTGYGVIQHSANGLRAVLYLDDNAIHTSVNSTTVRTAVRDVPRMRTLLEEGLKGAHSLLGRRFNSQATQLVHAAMTALQDKELRFGVYLPLPSS